MRGTQINLKIGRDQRSQLGFTIVEILVASAMVTAGSLFFTSAILQYGKASKKSAMVVQAINLESKLLDTISDGTNYQAGKATFAGGAIPAGFTLPLTTASTNPVVNVGFPSTIYFDGQLQACANFTDRNCLFKLEVDLIQRTISGITNNFAYAYRISFNPDVSLDAKTMVGNLGVQHNNPFAAPADYTFFIPRNVIMDDTIGDCDPLTDVAMLGFNRDTGQAICLKKPLPADFCPNGSLTKGFTIVGGRLVFDCGPPVKSWSCPANYSLQQFSPSSLDPAAGGANQCIYTAVDTGTRGTVQSGTITGNSCPTDYNRVNICTGPLAVISTDGVCNYTEIVLTTICVPQPDVYVFGVGMVPQPCLDTVITTFVPHTIITPAVPGILVQSYTPNNGINCYIQKAPQPCPDVSPYVCDPGCAATWDAQTSFATDCVLGVPSIVPAGSP